ncbi:MAG: hypothetical protein PHU12_03565 [Candidatus Aenigmarchaeota archaeon]|nr:hypothetical protein [Candidatus Aenigmarchaeota archaeon]
MKKAIALVSGGIDSPLAAKMMSKDYEIIAMHSVLYPFYCKGSFETTVSIMKKLGFKKNIFFPFGPILSKIAKRERLYRCVLCKKVMLRAAEMIAEKEGVEAIVTGESLAQKASQTLKNMAATSHGIKLPILRPLLALDKTEIIELAKKNDIYFEHHTGCCTITPDMPVTKADMKLAEDIYEELELDNEIRKQIKKMIVTDKLDNSILKKLI